MRIKRIIALILCAVMLAQPVTVHAATLYDSSSYSIDYRAVIYGLARLIRTAIKSISIRSSTTQKTEPEPVSGEIVIVTNKMCEVKDIGYGTNSNQKLDEKYYDDGVKKPVVVTVHGGSWTRGDKQAANIMSVVNELSQNGFFCVNINHRFGSISNEVADVKAAITWARGIDNVNADTNKIFVIGYSSGAHLSCCAVNELVASGRNYVSGVISLSGPIDLAGSMSYLSLIFGQYDPITTISSYLPPHLLIHGDSDSTVPVSSSRNYDAALKSAGVDSTLVIVSGMEHVINMGRYGGELIRWLKSH